MESRPSLFGWDMRVTDARGVSRFVPLASVLPDTETAPGQRELVIRLCRRSLPLCSRVLFLVAAFMGVPVWFGLSFLAVQVFPGVQSQVGSLAVGVAGLIGGAAASFAIVRLLWIPCVRRTYDRKFVAAAMTEGVCATCLYPLNGLAADGDGCVVCPECGGAWRRQ
jgi:hypothetical protein